MDIDLDLVPPHPARMDEPGSAAGVPACTTHGADACGCSDAPSHVHDVAVRTVCIRHSGGGVDVDALTRWLGSMLWDESHSADIFRIKGIIHAASSKLKHVVQVRTACVCILSFGLFRKSLM